MDVYSWDLEVSNRLSDVSSFHQIRRVENCGARGYAHLLTHYWILTCVKSTVSNDVVPLQHKAIRTEGHLWDRPIRKSFGKVGFQVMRWHPKYRSDRCNAALQRSCLFLWNTVVFLVFVT